MTIGAIRLSNNRYGVSCPFPVGGPLKIEVPLEGREYAHCVVNTTSGGTFASIVDLQGKPIIRAGVLRRNIPRLFIDLPRPISVLQNDSGIIIESLVRLSPHEPQQTVAFKDNNKIIPFYVVADGSRYDIMFSDRGVYLCYHSWTQKEPKRYILIPFSQSRTLGPIKATVDPSGKKVSVELVDKSSLSLEEYVIRRDCPAYDSNNRREISPNTHTLNVVRTLQNGDELLDPYRTTERRQVLLQPNNLLDNVLSKALETDYSGLTFLERINLAMGLVSSNYSWPSGNPDELGFCSSELIMLHFVLRALGVPNSYLIGLFGRVNRKTVIKVERKVKLVLNEEGAGPLVIGSDPIQFITKRGARTVPVSRLTINPGQVLEDIKTLNISFSTESALILGTETVFIPAPGIQVIRYSP